MLNNAALAALESALGYFPWLDGMLTGNLAPKRPRSSVFCDALNAVADYEQVLTKTVLEGIARFDPGKFRCYGITDPARSDLRDPTFGFEISGRPPAEVKKELWEKHRIKIADGNHYSAAVFRHLGRSSLCRASFAHDDNLETVKAFLSGLGDIMR